MAVWRVFWGSVSRIFCTQAAMQPSAARESPGEIGHQIGGRRAGDARHPRVRWLPDSSDLGSTDGRPAPAHQRSGRSAASRTTSSPNPDRPIGIAPGPAPPASSVGNLPRWIKFYAAGPLLRDRSEHPGVQKLGCGVRKFGVESRAETPA